MSRKPFSTKVVTANLLREGEVVYLAADGSWVVDLAQAELLTDEADAQVRLIEADLPSIVVGAYLADVEITPGGPRPTHFREDFRATGPTNHPHGKAHGQHPGPEGRDPTSPEQ